uniref:Uncharacterized protein n=1 Tax=Nelumbo nucifera TaxID=4432 RepID=A0A822XEZ6_NELNU|nr:TPA_asm: hypothetical protein HUJ06_020373 [Nelumbo nucifera]
MHATLKYKEIINQPEEDEPLDMLEKYDEDRPNGISQHTMVYRCVTSSNILHRKHKFVIYNRLISNDQWLKYRLETASM